MLQSTLDFIKVQRAAPVLVKKLKAAKDSRPATNETRTAAVSRKVRGGKSMAIPESFMLLAL
jgi:hypothetical protein